MMDGWTDKYKRLPYFAIRISIIHEWTLKVFTLSIDPVESHTSESLQRYVKSIMATFLVKKPMLFNTTDSAANMKLLSKLLGHDRIDCIAQSASSSDSGFNAKGTRVMHSIDKIEGNYKYTKF